MINLILESTKGKKITKVFENRKEAIDFITTKKEFISHDDIENCTFY